MGDELKPGGAGMKMIAGVISGVVVYDIAQDSVVIKIRVSCGSTPSHAVQEVCEQATSKFVDSLGAELVALKAKGVEL